MLLAGRWRLAPGPVCREDLCKDSAWSHPKSPLRLITPKMVFKVVIERSFNTMCMPSTHLFFQGSSNMHRFLQAQVQLPAASLMPRSSPTRSSHLVPGYPTPPSREWTAKKQQSAAPKSSCEVCLLIFQKVGEEGTWLDSVGIRCVF